MAMQHLSRLQQCILGWLATDTQRTKGLILSSHEDLVRALPGDNGNIRRSLQTLAARGWIVIGRSPGGKAQHLTLTPEGRQRASEMRKKVSIRDNIPRNND